LGYFFNQGATVGAVLAHPSRGFLLLKTIPWSQGGEHAQAYYDLTGDFISKGLLKSSQYI
jgi:hypothetical protein